MGVVFRWNYIVCQGKKCTSAMSIFYNSCKQRQILTKFCSNNTTSNCRQLAKLQQIQRDHLKT